MNEIKYAAREYFTFIFAALFVSILPASLLMVTLQTDFWRAYTGLIAGLLIVAHIKKA
jgi:hypothetical protein